MAAKGEAGMVQRQQPVTMGRGAQDLDRPQLLPTELVRG